MTFDSWTSLNGDPFLSVTAHYITAPADKPQQWELRSDQLAFTPIVGNHSGENIAKILVETIDEYDIRSKVFTLPSLPCLFCLIKLLWQFGWFTADNATNNDTAIRAVAEHIDPTGDEWDPVQHRVRYAAIVIILRQQEYLLCFLAAWSTPSIWRQNTL